MRRELWAAVLDALAYGDWAGHWRAWWQVWRGDVTGETRAGWPGEGYERVEGCTGAEGEYTGTGAEQGRDKTLGRGDGLPVVVS